MGRSFRHRFLISGISENHLAFTDSRVLALFVGTRHCIARLPWCARARCGNLDLPVGVI